MTTAVWTGCYVFAIVPAGSPIPEGEEGGPAAGLTLVEAGDLGAVVGHVPTNRPLGRAADLRAHDRVISELVAAGTPVLPMRFGAVVADEDAVVNELLLPHRAQFQEALGTLRGRVQYTLHAQYDEEAAVRLAVASNPEIRRMRESGATDHASQVQLGQLVATTIEQLRPADSSAILNELIGTVDVRVHEPSAPDEVLHAAFLVDVTQSADFERRVEHAAEQRANRIRFRLIGPVAAYDFVGDA
jgi:hypothetical protein